VRTRSSPLVLALTLVAGCPQGEDDAGVSDAGADAGDLVDGGHDAGGADAGFDGGHDAGGADAGFDGGHDAGVDAGLDGGHDAGFDGGHDAGASDAGMDAGVDAGIDAGVDGGIDAGVDGGVDAGATDAGFDAGPLDAGWSVAPAVDEVFAVDDRTLARFELNGDVLDSSGHQRDGVGADAGFVASAFGQAMVLGASDTATGFGWDAHAALLTHPFTIEMVLTPNATLDYVKLFSPGDVDVGWYYVDYGVGSYHELPPDQESYVGAGQVFGQRRHYLAFVSTDAENMLVYYQGVALGEVPLAFTAPPVGAFFLRDDTETGYETIVGTAEAVRVSSGARAADEIGAVQARLEAR
jgi:hypothetical protein